MPELPEVETVARTLARRVTGDVIESVWIGGKPQPLLSPARTIARTLTGARIAQVRRVGKHVVVDLERAGESPASTQETRHAQWIVHLGMTGKLVACPPEAEVAKHTHLVARLRSGMEIRFVDARRFGRLRVLRRERFAAPGAEPLVVGFEMFAALFHHRKAPIKSALLNQSLLSGVGNIYADEALFRAGIRSRRRAHTLTRAELRRLYAALRQVLREAIAAGGTTVADYVDGEGRRGLFQFELRVYGRAGEPCRVCGTAIRRIVISGRSAHYCGKCQK